MPRIENSHDAVRDAIEHPVGVASLAELARPANCACIAICDITRPVPNHLFLRAVIETLIDSGVPKDEITVLVATGLHRPCEGDELEELVGDAWVLENVPVLNHFARHDEDHVSLGVTSTRGTVVRLDRRFVEADLRIATGLVEPHFMAGYSHDFKLLLVQRVSGKVAARGCRIGHEPGTVKCRNCFSMGEPRGNHFAASGVLPFNVKQPSPHACCATWAGLNRDIMTPDWRGISATWGLIVPESASVTSLDVDSVAWIRAVGIRHRSELNLPLEGST